MTETQQTNNNSWTFVCPLCDYKATYVLGSSFTVVDSGDTAFRHASSGVTVRSDEYLRNWLNELLNDVSI